MDDLKLINPPSPEKAKQSILKTMEKIKKDTVTFSFPSKRSIEWGDFKKVAESQPLPADER